MTELILENKWGTLILLISFSVITTLLSKLPLWDFVFFQSKRKKDYLADEVESFKVLKTNIKDEDSIIFLNKELEHKLLLRYLNLRFISPKRMNKMLSLYKQNEELNNYSSLRSFLRYHHAFRNDGYFNNTSSFFFTIFFAVISFLFGILAVFISIVQKESSDLPMAIFGFAIFYILLLPTIGNYGAKRRFNKIIVKDNKKTPSKDSV